MLTLLMISDSKRGQLDRGSSPKVVTWLLLDRSDWPGAPLLRARLEAAAQVDFVILQFGIEHGIERKIQLLCRLIHASELCQVNGESLLYILPFT